MELVYLWVEEYKNIKEQGFNFSPKFDCNYDKVSNELTIDKKEDYVNIFPDNINITAIVGENGSGKSNILSSLIFDSIDIASDINLFIVYKIDGKLIFYFIENISGRMTKEVAYEENKTYDISIESLKDYIGNNNFKTIFYSTAAIEDMSYTYDGINDNTKILSLTEDTKPITKKLESIKNTIYMIKEKVEFKELFKLPQRIYINIKPYNKKDPIFEQLNNKFRKKTLKDNIYIKLILEINHKEKIKDLETKIKEKKTIKDICDYVVDKIEHPWKNCIKEFTNILEITEVENNLSIESISDDFIKTYKEMVNTQFIYNFDILDFNWYAELSSGQETYLFQLADFYYEISTVLVGNTVYKKFLLLIDEGDNTLHPQWQKQYINFLINFLKENFSEEIEIQIVLTSHSPFILSDIPKENLIFLKNGKQDFPFKKNEQTFGANIHTLLSHGFFMDNGLMGEFAKSKIEEIKKFYEVIKKLEKRILSKDSTKKLAKKSFEKRKKRFEHIQSIIGEPFLQTVIKNYLDEIEPLLSDNNTLIDNEINQLEAKIKKLKSLKNG